MSRIEAKPVIRDGDPKTIWSAILTATYQQSDLVDVADWRELTLLLNIDPAAADGTTPISCLPLLSASQTRPDVDDDVWFSPGVTDGSVTAAALSATIATGADYTGNPEWNQVQMRPLEILPSDVMDNAATDEIRIAITINVAWAKWFHLAAADPSNAGTLATLIAQVVRSA